MLIIYRPNPLHTEIILDQHERDILWHKIKIEQLEEILYSAHYAVSKNDNERALNELDPSQWCVDGKSSLDKRVDEIHRYYIRDLRSAHAGDCTAFPATCTKCMAEGMLGISTISGMYKSMGYKVHTTFAENPAMTTRDAIDILKRTTPSTGSPYSDTWNKTLADTIKWLEKYDNLIKDEYNMIDLTNQKPRLYISGPGVDIYTNAREAVEPLIEALAYAVNHDGDDFTMMDLDEVKTLAPWDLNSSN